MKVLGISPLDKDATASFVQDGRLLFAAGEERFSRIKQHAGFPAAALAAGLQHCGWSERDIDWVAYPFLSAADEAALIARAFDSRAAAREDFAAAAEAGEQGAPSRDIARLLAEAEARPARRPALAAGGAVHGLRQPEQRMEKDIARRLAYRVAAVWGPASAFSARFAARRWARRAVEDHRRHEAELLAQLDARGLTERLVRCEHHLSHAANAYLTSGFERALIITLDGYGSGLAGSVNLGEGGRITRLASQPFPHSLGSFYEAVTSSLGYSPDRHAGKIVGLAAWGDPQRLAAALLARTSWRDGGFRLDRNLDVFFSRHVAARFPMIDVAAGWQHVLEVLGVRLVEHWVAQTGCEAVVLSGGVAANVKLNQRLHHARGVKRLFVYPNMGDGGCGSGLALLLSWAGRAEQGAGPSPRDPAQARRALLARIDLQGGLTARAGAPPAPLHDVYLGPSWTDAQLESALHDAGLPCERPADMATRVAALIHSGAVVARFDGRMEYGPRALGNRSVLYHARRPEVNQWLNARLGRTEFMPFAPITAARAAARCYEGLAGAEHAAEFMTVTFDCTPWMREQCPAAVHVDGTARPQLVRPEVNPGAAAILDAYERLAGIPTLINTSFNMHEEPIVCSPQDAIRAFRLGRLDALALGPFLTLAPQHSDGGEESDNGGREPRR